jgi:hypothetical protein
MSSKRLRRWRAEAGFSSFDKLRTTLSNVERSPRMVGVAKKAAGSPLAGYQGQDALADLTASAKATAGQEGPALRTRR